MTFSKYIIHHLDLSNRPEPLLDVTDPGHYCVFWYRSVPLGESYLLLSDAIAPEVFWKKCLQAIASSLEMYAAKENRPLSLSSLSPDPVSIRTACARILEDFHPQILPQRCDVSVVICTRNRAGYLKNCLESLRDQVCQPAEVIVVDNGSDTDETAKVASGFNVRYIREDTRGLDVARNTGARAATGAIVAFTDDDTLPDKLWVYRIYETFRDPKIAAMTGLVIAASLDTEAEVIFEKFWPFNRGYRDKIFDSQFFRARLDDGPPVWEIGAGANMAFRKEIFDEVGYFDERLDVGAAGCSGDSELWYRTLACGFSIHYNPRAVVRHYHRNSIPGLRRQLYAYMRGFTVAILIQHQRFGHRGNLQRLFRILPVYYMKLLKRGFPRYDFQYRTLFSELTGVFSGLFYYLRHRNTDPKIYGNDVF